LIIYVNSFGRPDIGLRGLFSSPIDTIPSSIDLIGLKNKLAPPIVDLKIAKRLDTHYAWIQHIVLAVAVRRKPFGNMYLPFFEHPNQ
jgi:hypothetical protein